MSPVPRSLWGCQHRIEQPQEVAPGGFEVGIDRHRIHFGPSDFVVAGIVPDLDVGDFTEGCVLAPVDAVTIEPSEIVLVAGDGAERHVPHHLGPGIGIVHIDERKRLTRDVAKQAAVIGRQSHLAGILFGRVLVRRRPVDTLGRNDLDRHPMQHAEVLAGGDEVFDLRRVVGSDEVSRVHLCRCGRVEKSDQDGKCGKDSEAMRSPSQCAIHMNSSLRHMAADAGI